jgi:hypothetical protein
VKRGTYRQRSATRQNELEERWKQAKFRNKELGKVAPSAHVHIAEIKHGVLRDGVVPQYPGKLRGPDFVRGLLYFSAYLNDPRFTECADALVKLGIVDKGYNFTGKKPPEIERFMAGINNRKQETKTKLVNEVRQLIKQTEGMSAQRACEEVTADWGLPASNFDAAFERLKRWLGEAKKSAKTKPNRGKRVRM